MLVPSHSFWTRTWRDAHWAPDLAYLPSGAPLVAALSSEFMLAVFEPATDALAGGWACRQLLHVPSDRADELLAELDAQLTCFHWLHAPLRPGRDRDPGCDPDPDLDLARPLVTGARSGRVSVWAWDYARAQLRPQAHHRIASDPIWHIAMHSFGPHAALVLATRRHLLCVCLSWAGALSPLPVVLDVENVHGLVFGPDATLAIACTGKIGFASLSLHLPHLPPEAAHPPSPPAVAVAPIQWCVLAPLYPQPSCEASDGLGLVEADELSAQVESRPLAPWSSPVSLQPLASGAWSLVLANGACYLLPSFASHQHQHDAHRPVGSGSHELPPAGRLVVEPRRDKSTDRQHLALAMLQDVATCLIVPSPARAVPRSTAAWGANGKDPPPPPPHRTQSAWALAARSDDELAPLRFRGIHARLQVCLATLVPQLSETELLEEAEACVYPPTPPPARTPSHMTTTFLTDAFTQALPPCRQKASQQILRMLRSLRDGADVRLALWLAVWLEVCMLSHGCRAARVVS